MRTLDIKTRQASQGLQWSAIASLLKGAQMLAYRFLFLAVWLSWLTPCAAQEGARALPANGPLKVLLIGNSFTYTNSLASKLTSFANATSQPRPWQVFEQAMQNARLAQMWGLRTTEYMLKNEPWDYIVLQEHGGNVDPEGLLSTARKFDAAARKMGAKIILFENPRSSASAQAELTDLFVKLGKELGVQVAPVGQAWHLVRETDPSIQLREGDGHPSFVGQYVSGCVIYMTISETDSCPAVLGGSIDEHISSVTREAAQRAVADSRAIMQTR